MLLKVDPLAKRGSAEVAAVRSLGRVDKLMSLEKLPLQKRLFAKITLEFLVSDMLTSVDQILSSLSEALGTMVALKRSDIVFVCT